MNNVSSGSYKKNVGDTRNNWVTMMFVTKYRFNCFRKQSHINTCKDAFQELERFGFEFGDFDFAGNHVHFQVNIPKRYSVQNAEIMLKSRSAKRIFEQHPGFRKRYPHGSFWSGYEHHESTGKINLKESSTYLRGQQQHHGVTVTDDTQRRLLGVHRRVRCGMPEGLAEERRRNGVIGALPLFHLSIIFICIVGITG